jgi:hypothetical protein
VITTLLTSSLKSSQKFRNMNATYVAPANFELISTQILASATATVTFSSIPQTYKHLQLRFTARDSSAFAGSSIYMNLNGDVGSNYSDHLLGGNGSSATSGSDVSSTYMRLGAVTANSSTASAFGAGITDILDYTSTTKNKTIRTLIGAVVSTNNFVYLSSGAWLSTAAVTSLSITDVPSGVSFMAGSRFSLYGVLG